MKCVSALRTGSGVRPPIAHSEPSAITSHRSSEDVEVGATIGAGGDLVDQLDAAGRADAARRALAARLDRAELHREASLRGHVDRVVEHHDAAVADHRVVGGERLVVERQVEAVDGQVRAQRAADLRGANRATAGRATTEVVDQLVEGDAERGLDDAAVGDVAGQLEHLCATAATGAERRVARRHRRPGSPARWPASARC